MAGQVRMMKAMRPTMRLLSRLQVTTAAAASVSTRHARSNQDASNENQRRVMMQIAGGAAALLLTAGIVAGNDAGGWSNNAHCESLQRLDTSNRRHTGTTRKKSGAATERAEDYCPHDQEEHEEDGDSQVATTAYFDAEYETKSLIGAGTFGMVMQCVSKKDGHVAAVKMVQDLMDNSDEVAREKQALSFIQQSGGHEHIIRYDGSYSHNGFHYIVTEYVAGDSLFAFLEKRRRVDVRTALQLVAQLANALRFLQQSGIVHRDLKPENIMVLYDEKDDTPVQDEKLKLKIIDFGSARTSPSSSLSDADDDEEELQEQPATISLSGTRCYWSPEVLQNQEMTPAMDMWSLGCLLYILISGCHPFDLMGSSSEEQIVQRVTTESVSFLHPVWMDVPQQVKELVRGLLEKDPHQRFSVDDVLTHSSILSASASTSKKL